MLNLHKKENPVFLIALKLKHNDNLHKKYPLKIYLKTFAMMNLNVQNQSQLSNQEILFPLKNKIHKIIKKKKGEPCSQY